MKQKLLFLTLVLLTIAGCTKTQKDDLKTSNLTCTSETILNFDAAGGNGEITYLIENPVEGEEIRVNNDCEWITDINIGNSITFTVVPNTETQERSHTIVVSYMVQSFEVTVNQGGATNSEEEYEFSITSEMTMEFNAQGGSGEITYEIEPQTSSEQILTNCEASWIENITIGETITFSVAPNTETQERSTELEVSFLEQSYTITILQDGAADTPQDIIEHTANYLNGEYYGSYNSSYNYYIFLSDLGINGETSFIPNSTVIRLDLYSSKSSNNSAPVLPTGTFTLDPQNTCKAGTISAMYSAYIAMGEEAIDAYLGFEDATVTITENSIEVIFSLMDGTTHRMTYQGELGLTMP